MDRLREQLRNELVVAVKQTYTDLSGIVDFHVFNRINHVHYDYSDPPPIRVVADGPGSRLGADLFFPVRYEGLANSVVSTGKIEAALFRKGEVSRPWGPGCMYDLVFPLLVWMGVKQIVTLGFDTEPVAEREYFYGSGDKASVAQERLNERRLIAAGVPLWYQWMQRHGIEWTYVAHDMPTALAGIVPSVNFDDLAREDSDGRLGAD